MGVIVFSSMPAAPIEASLAMTISWQAEGHQHGVPLDRLGHVGHGPHGVQFFAGEEVGQVVGRAEFAPAAGILLALGHVELEDQHQPGVFLLGLLHRPANDPAGPLEGLAGHRQREADEAADLPGLRRESLPKARPEDAPTRRPTGRSIGLAPSVPRGRARLLAVQQARARLGTTGPDYLAASNLTLPATASYRDLRYQIITPSPCRQSGASRTERCEKAALGACMVRQSGTR